MEWVVVWVMHVEHWRCLFPVWGNHQARYPPWLLGRLPGKVNETVSMVCVSLMVSQISWLLLSQPFLVPSDAVHLCIMNMLTKVGFMVASTKWGI